MLTNPTLLNKVDLRKYDNSLSTAIADTDLVGKTLVVTEAVTCGTVTIPDTIALEILNGGSISVNVGATLSVNGPYDSCVETPFLGSGNVIINSPVKNNNHDNLSGTAVHGLGTASTADVTTSATDTTAGRLLKVGDFGLGGGNGDGYWVVDCNNLHNELPAGKWNIYITTDSANRPPGLTAGARGFVRIGNDKLYAEVLICDDSTNQKMFIRSLNFGSWGAWNEVLHTENHTSLADPHSQYLLESGGTIHTPTIPQSWGGQPLIIQHDNGINPGIGFHAEASSSAGILKFYGPSNSFEVRNSDGEGFVDLKAAQLFSNGAKVIERTVTASGSYVKFSDGFQICLCSYPTGSTDRAVTFPAQFNSPPHVVSMHNSQGSDSSAFSTSFSSLTVSGVTISPRYITDSLVKNASESGHIIAMGY